MGHCIKDKALAGEYLKYWNLLKEDPAKDKLKIDADANSRQVGLAEIFQPLK